LPNLAAGPKFVGADGADLQKATNWNHWGPRFGFAYSVTRTTVVRGGYGLFFLPSTGDDQGTNLGSAGFSATTPFSASLDGGLTPANSLSNPFPQGITVPSGNSQKLVTLLGPDLVSVHHDDRSAYSQQSNFDIHQHIPGEILFDVAYDASKGTALPVDIQADQLPDQSLSRGSALLQQLNNPFLRHLQGRFFECAHRFTRAVLLRPFPQFNSVNIRGCIKATPCIIHSR
jgi:hypothetical protein